jgi:glycerol kinase
VSGSRVILALDQGTTSSRAFAVDAEGRIVASAQRDFPQQYPSPGHVTHDPEQIWSSQLGAAREVVAAVGGAAAIAAIGITNQRETTLVWDRATGLPVADAIVWQSRITAPFCEELRRRGVEPLVRSRTGLPLDAYFSGPKIRHILDAEPALRARAEAGELCFGTVDSFLLWRLTGGGVHATDVTNASRTLLFDIHRLRWDEELLALMEVPAAVLPAVHSTSEIHGETSPEWFGASIPIGALAGDQQAATFGQACLHAGQAKTTYGTGAFLLLTTENVPVESGHGLLTTVGWQLGPDAPVSYALEGSVFVAGAAVQWLRDGLRGIASAGEIEALATSVPDSGGVLFVPAFVGLGAPYWDPDARGAMFGLTRGTGLAQIARATLESICFGVRDVIDAMAADTGSTLDVLRVDGGAAVNDTLLQLQADILGVPVERPASTESTALGAAYLGGLAIGFWKDPAEIEEKWRLDRRFEPQMAAGERDRRYERWQRAVAATRAWSGPPTAPE